MIPTDEIISMANQCGLPLTYVPHDDDTFSPHVDGLVAFANLVAARAAEIEREKVDALVEALKVTIERDEAGVTMTQGQMQDARAALTAATGENQ